MVGVGSTPTSTTSQPAASSPHCTACCSMGPLARVSRPTTTRPPPTYVPNACANSRARPGVKNSPTTPRIPETPIFSKCSLGKAPHLIEQRVKQGHRRLAALLANHPHDRLGLAHANVKPPLRPVHAQSIGCVDPAIAIALAQVHQQCWNALRHQRDL